MQQSFLYCLYQYPSTKMSSPLLDKSMMAEVKEDTDSMFSVASSKRARGHGNKVTQKKNRLTHKTLSYCSIRVAKHWNRLPK